jgi:hypothetical protein
VVRNQELEAGRKFLMKQGQKGKEEEGLGSRSYMTLLALKSGRDTSSGVQKEKWKCRAI